MFAELFRMCNYNTINFRSEDSLKFTKFRTDGSWSESSVGTCYYYTTGIHKFTTKIISSPNRYIVIGIFSDKFDIRASNIGRDDNSDGYYCFNGIKTSRGVDIPYGSSCAIGDTIDLILDLTNTYGTVEIIRNGLS